MMGGEEDNDAVVDHIWINLVDENDTFENVMDTAGENQKSIPLLYPSWLVEVERAHKGQQIINTEVLRRMTMERHNAQSDPTQTEEEKTGVTQTASEDNNELKEKDSNIKPPSNMLSRGPSRTAKMTMSYRRNIGKDDNRWKDADTTFLTTLDP